MFEEFFKRHIRLTITFLFLGVFILVFVMPKAYFGLDSNAKKIFFGIFLASFGIIMFIFFGRKSRENESTKKKIKSTPSQRSYQNFVDEIELCQMELKRHRMWAYGCLIVGWIALWMGRMSGHPPYNHPIFAIPIFGLAFLVATRSWEKENELDVTIAKCTLEGVEIEKKRPGLHSSYFSELLNSYKGWGMWQFAFIRVSPSLMIIFSVFNSGALSFLANHLSIPTWIANSVSGIILGSVFLFFARIACRPYYWMLGEMKALPM